MDMELLNLEGLTTEERTIILNVIRRDDELRRRQDNRVSQLKGEIHNLRMNSVLRNGDDLSKMCARCKSPFGMVTNTGDVCPACRFKVCKNCRERLLSHGWLCVLCFKENQMKWLTGDWMAKNEKQAAHNLNATDLVRASLRVKHANGKRDDEDEDDVSVADELDSAYSSTANTSLQARVLNVSLELDDGGVDSMRTTPGTVSPIPLDPASPHLGPEGADRLQKNSAINTAFERDGEGSQGASAVDAWDTVEQNNQRSLQSDPGDDVKCAIEHTSGGEQPDATVPVWDTQPEGSSIAVAQGRTNQVPPLEVVGALVARMRTPETNVPYTIQRYFSADDSNSDTLSIISEVTEPGEAAHGDDRTLNDDDSGSDSDDTLHDDLDDNWSDDGMDLSDFVAVDPEGLSDFASTVEGVPNSRDKASTPVQADVSEKDWPQTGTEQDQQQHHDDDRQQAVDGNERDSQPTGELYKERVEKHDTQSMLHSSWIPDMDLNHRPVPSDSSHNTKNEHHGHKEGGHVRRECSHCGNPMSSVRGEDTVPSKETREEESQTDHHSQVEGQQQYLEDLLSQHNQQEEEEEEDDDDETGVNMVYAEDGTQIEDHGLQQDEAELTEDFTQTEAMCAAVCPRCESFVDRGQQTSPHLVHSLLPGKRVCFFGEEVHVIDHDDYEESSEDDDEEEIETTDGGSADGAVDNVSTQEHLQHMIEDNLEVEHSLPANAKCEENVCHDEDTESQDLGIAIEELKDLSDGEESSVSSQNDHYSSLDSSSLNEAIFLDRDETSMGTDIHSPELAAAEVNEGLDSPSTFQDGGHGASVPVIIALGVDVVQDREQSFVDDADEGNKLDADMSSVQVDGHQTLYEVPRCSASYTGNAEERQEENEEDDVRETNTETSGEEMNVDTAGANDNQTVHAAVSSDVTAQVHLQHVASDVSAQVHPQHVASDDLACLDPVTASPENVSMSATFAIDGPEVSVLEPNACNMLESASPDSHVESQPSSLPEQKSQGEHRHTVTGIQGDTGGSSPRESLSEHNFNTRSSAPIDDALTSTNPSEISAESAKNAQIIGTAGHYHKDARDVLRNSIVHPAFRRALGGGGGHNGAKQLSQADLSPNQSVARSASFDDKLGGAGRKQTLLELALSQTKNLNTSVDSISSRYISSRASTGSKCSSLDSASGASSVPDAADNFQIPAIHRSRQSDGDHASGSEYSGHGSPDKLRGSSQHLSPPSIGTSRTGSLEEQRSGDDDDIDELFSKHRMRSSLGVSRSSLGDSRESLASVYSDAGEINYGRIPVTGDIVFGLDYDHKKSALVITIKGCHDLAPVDIKHNRSDPYVKVYLLPDKTRSGKRKSKIKKHTLSPVYNETLTYNISRGELENRTLWVTVWHSDRFGRNDFLGEVLIPMDTYRFDDPSPRAYSLQTRMQENISEEAMQYKGDLVISLMYITPDHADGPNNKKSKSKSKKSKSASQLQGEIHCMIKAARNLTAVRSSGASDPFVKGYLLPDRTRTGKQKTSVVKNSVNPTWNHNLVFDGVEKEELADRCLELTAWDHEKLGTNEFLGGARLNLGHGTVKGSQVEWMDARGEEVTAWQSMIESPNTWIDARLPLRSSMGKPSKK